MFQGVLGSTGEKINIFSILISGGHSLQSAAGQCRTVVFTVRRQQVHVHLGGPQAPTVQCPGTDGSWQCNIQALPPLMSPPALVGRRDALL